MRRFSGFTVVVAPRAIAHRVVAAAALLTIMPGAARAQVYFYDLFYSSYYDQTSRLPPGPPLAHVFASRVIAHSGDMTASTVTLPGGSPVLSMSDLGGGYFLFSSPPFTSFDQMTAAYPEGPYQFDIAGGSLGPLSATLMRPTFLAAPTDTPAFAPETFDLLASNPDPGAGIALAFNTFAPGAGANLGITFVTVFDLNGGAPPFNTSFPPWISGVTIPAGTLAPATSYLLALYFSSRIETTIDGFGGATSIIGVDNVTQVSFTTGAGSAACGLADITGIGGPPSTPDGLLTGDDFNAFISAFAAGDALADVCGIGGPPEPPDGLVTGDDFNAFIAAFAAGCP